MALGYHSFMNITYPIAAVGELIGENARAAILIALLDEKALPAGELARLAGVSAQSASGHLSKLVDGGLLRAEVSGRQRLYRIAKPEVAYAWKPWERSQPHRRCGTSSAILGSKPCAQRDRVTTIWQDALRWR